MGGLLVTLRCSLRMGDKGVFPFCSISPFSASQLLSPRILCSCTRLISCLSLWCCRAIRREVTLGSTIVSLTVTSVAISPWGPVIRSRFKFRFKFLLAHPSVSEQAALCSGRSCVSHRPGSLHSLVVQGGAQFSEQPALLLGSGRFSTWEASDATFKTPIPTSTTTNSPSMGAPLFFFFSVIWLECYRKLFLQISCHGV